MVAQSSQGTMGPRTKSSSNEKKCLENRRPRVTDRTALELPIQRTVEEKHQNIYCGFMDQLGADKSSASTGHGKVHLWLGGIWGQRKGKKVLLLPPHKNVLHLFNISCMAKPQARGRNKDGSSTPIPLRGDSGLRAVGGLLRAAPLPTWLQRRP